MIGIVLITHGRLGEALREIVEHVVGTQRQLETLAVDHADDVAALRPALLDRVRRVDTGDGVLVLTDIFGSTPSNVALSVRREGVVEVMAGVNVPMLVKLAKARAQRDLDACIELATMAGRKYIAAASQLPESCLQGGKCCESVVAGTMNPQPAASTPIMPMRRTFH